MFNCVSPYVEVQPCVYSRVPSMMSYRCSVVESLLVSINPRNKTCSMITYDRYRNVLYRLSLFYYECHNHCVLYCLYRLWLLIIVCYTACIGCGCLSMCVILLVSAVVAYQCVLYCLYRLWLLIILCYTACIGYGC